MCFFHNPHDSRRKCLLVLRLFRKATVNVEPGGSNITHNQATNIYWHEIDYVGERVSDNTPVLAVFVKDVELYCQRITNEKMRNNFLSLLNKHESNRVMNISLNDLDYDSDELQDIFKMAVARNLEQ